jgi:hypothetical protein
LGGATAEVPTAIRPNSAARPPARLPTVRGWRASLAANLTVDAFGANLRSGPQRRTDQQRIQRGRLLGEPAADRAGVSRSRHRGPGLWCRNGHHSSDLGHAPLRAVVAPDAPQGRDMVDYAGPGPVPVQLVAATAR